MDDVTIRNATLDDLLDIRNMVLELESFENKLLKELNYDENLINQTLSENIINKLKKEIKNDDSHVIVAELNKCIVGFCRGNVPRKGNNSYLDQLFVKSEYRNRGIGYKLTMSFVNIIYEINSNAHIIIPTIVNNERAKQFYKSLNMKEIYVYFDCKVSQVQK